VKSAETWPPAPDIARLFDRLIEDIVWDPPPVEAMDRFDKLMEQHGLDVRAERPPK
jgi:hypothetical protein